MSPIAESRTIKIRLGPLMNCPLTSLAELRGTIARKPIEALMMGHPGQDRHGTVQGRFLRFLLFQSLTCEKMAAPLQSAGEPVPEQGGSQWWRRPPGRRLLLAIRGTPWWPRRKPCRAGEQMASRGFACARATTGRSHRRRESLSALGPGSGGRKRVKNKLNNVHTILVVVVIVIEEASLLRLRQRQRQRQRQGLCALVDLFLTRP